MKRLVFACFAMALSTLLAVGGLFGFDLYLHERYKHLVGLNMRGYRGPIVGRKQPGEWRIVVLGGSTAFGYGLPYEQSFPAYLEQKLKSRLRSHRDVSVGVVNLAYNAEGAYAMKFALADYAYLDYDVALLYTGYNDLSGPNTYLFRHTSPIFRFTGYLPIFPLVLKEKALALRYGSVEAGYRAEHQGATIIFSPSLANRATASILETVAGLGQAMATLTPPHTPSVAAMNSAEQAVECEEPWRFYCHEVITATQELLDQRKWVAVVTQPYLSQAHREQQQALRKALHERFPQTGRLRYADLGSAVDLQDRQLSYDGMHLTAAGNELLADHMLPVLLEMVAPDNRATSS